MNFPERLEVTDALKKITEGLKSLPTQLFVTCKDGHLHLFAQTGGVVLPGVGYITVLDHTISKKDLRQYFVALASAYLSAYKRPMTAAAIAKQAIMMLVKMGQKDFFGRFPQSTIIVVDNLVREIYVVNMGTSARYSTDHCILGVGRFSSVLTNSLKSLSPYTLTCRELRAELQKEETYRGTDLRPGSLKVRRLDVVKVVPIAQYSDKGPNYTSHAHSLDEGGYDQMGPFIEHMICITQLSPEDA
jgi:hypothetical protein